VPILNTDLLQVSGYFVNNPPMKVWPNSMNIHSTFSRVGLLNVGYRSITPSCMLAPSHLVLVSNEWLLSQRAF
jgi:hypothetical protein